MATYLETLNGVKEQNFGFFNTNAEIVLLGKLPPMPTDQFCEYTTRTMFAILEHGDQKSIAAIAYASGQLHAWLEKPHATMSFAIKPESPYKENPFRFDGNTVMFSVGDTKYEVAPSKFVQFWYYLMRGGFHGWDNHQLIPQSIVNAIKNVDQRFYSA